MSHSIIFHLILLLFLGSLVKTKLYARDFRSTSLRYERGWIYLDRMRFAPGQAKITFWTYVQTQTLPSHGKYRLNLFIIPDRLWDSQEQKRCDSIQVPQQLIQKQSNNKQVGPSDEKKHIITLQLNAQNNLTDKSTLYIRISKQTTFYFVLSDCDKTMSNEYFNKKSRFDIQVDMTNNNKSYGADQALYTWTIPLIIGICSILLYLLSKSGGDRDYQDTNWAEIILKIILWTHIIGLFFFYFGHIIYITGRGNFYNFFPFIYLIVSSVSQTMTLILVTFCAYGWMTTYKINDQQDIYYPIAAVSGFGCIVLTMLSKINDGDTTKTHMYDFVTYDILFVFKIVCLCSFIFGIVRSNIKFRKNGAFIRYINQLGIFGAFCYLAVPFYVFNSGFLSKHNRWAQVFIFVQLIRTVQIVIMCWQMISKNSIYNQLTLHGRSFMQQENKYL